MMHGKKGHAISMHAKCCCTSMMLSSPYRCCGDAEDALFTQSLSCNHMLDALFTMHNCTYMQTQTNHKCRLLKTCNMHFSQCTQQQTNHKCTLEKHTICIFHNAHNNKQITSTCAQTCYMHYAEHTQSQTNHTLACRYKCTYSMCIIHTILHKHSPCTAVIHV